MSDPWFMFAMESGAGVFGLRSVLVVAALLGVVEGVTEFIPVSSTGHLILASDLLGFESLVGEGPAKTFEIFIQLGAILAVVVAYPRRFGGLLPWRDNSGFRGLRGLSLLALTSLPAGLVGVLARGTIKEHLFQPLTVAVGLAAGAVWILAAERWPRPVRRAGLDQLRWRDALAVGLFQCLALWPGMSRSSSTILGGMWLGLDRKTAAEYSFFAAVPLLAAAALYELVKSRSTLSAADIPWFAVGFLVSYVFAWLAVRFFIRFLSRHTLAVFGWYRLAIAAAAMFWALRG
jgi:undecaprenyl-diphosphatase